MIQSVLPHPPVGDTDSVNRIRKLAEYVARNGPEFEIKVKEKEAGNAAFSFLDPNLDLSGNQYYSWLLFCAKHFYTAEQVEQIEALHCTRIRSASISGMIDLTQEDYTFYTTLLSKNTGSKEFIKEARNWFLTRSHSASAVSFLFIDHMKNLCATFVPNQESGLFKSMLHAVYAINDIMFNSAAANSEGPYTRILKEHSAVNIVNCLIPQLPHILYLAHKSALIDSEREKVARVVNIWVTRLFIDEACGEALVAGMKNDAIGGIEPVRPTFQSPYPQRLPPPNLSPQQQQIQLQQQQQQQQQMQQQQTHHQPVAPLQPQIMQIAPSLAFPCSAPQMPLFRPPPSFPLGAAPGIPGGGLPPQFQFLPQGMMGQPPPTFPPPSLLPLQQQIQQQQLLNMQQMNQFGTFSQQAFAPPPGYPGFGPSPQVAIPAMAVNTPVLDLHKISVGTMANIVKAAVKGGHPRYVPLDVATMAHVVPPYVEPGRLEARVSEYYRKLEIALGGAPPQAEAPFDAYTAFMNAGSSGGDRGGDRGGGGGGSSGNGGSDMEPERMPRGSVYGGGEYAHMPPQHPHAQALTDDNEGHKLLRRMGWQEGSGLGAEGGGIIEPIRETVKKDKTGIGSTTGGSVPPTEYSSYRQQLSSEYHARIGPDHRG